MRSTLASGFVCAVYAIFGGVVWSAYQEFGAQSLLDLPPLVRADATPVKLLPDEGGQGRAALPVRSGSERSGAAALARGEGPVAPLSRSGPAASLSTGEASEADTRVMTARPAIAPDDTEPVVAAGPAGAEVPVVAALETPAVDVRAAAPFGSATDAVSDEVPRSGTAATWPPVPAFKPLDAVPVVVAQAVLVPPGGSETETMSLGDTAPVPSLKPVIVPAEQRPRDTHRVATGPTLPDALRAFWTNLKVLLAAPAPRIVPAGGNSSHRRDDRSGGNGGFASASVSGGDTAGGGSSSSGGGSSSIGGSGSSGGRASGGTGGSSSGSASGGDSGNTSGASSSSSTSAGGDRGDGGRGGGGKGKDGGGGKGGRDGGKGGRDGGGKGGRDGGGKGGKGDDRGGDDDD